MLRFKDFVNKNLNRFDFDKFKLDCAPFLEALKGSKNALYHGNRHGPETWSIETVNKNRLPRTTPILVSKAVDEFFNEKFGYAARSQSIFTSGSNSVAYVYGKGYVIFPIGEFRSLWSGAVDDLTAFHLHNAPFRVNYKDDSEEAIKEITEFVDLLKTLDWHYNSDLPDGINSGSEILISCDKFYCIRASDDLFTETILPWLKDERIII